MKKSINRAVLGAAIFAASMAANSQNFTPDSGAEWKLLGPAFSKHTSAVHAPITKPKTGSWLCKQTAYAYDCTGITLPEQRGWSETNPAFGLEISKPVSPGSQVKDLFFASLVRDSYREMSFMAGVGRYWPLAAFGRIKINGGLAGGLWYRSSADGDAVGGKVQNCFSNSPYPRQGSQDCAPQSDEDYFVTPLTHSFVPFFLPFLSLEDQKTGLGANISVMPEMNMGRLGVVPTTTIMIQITYKLNFK